MLVNRPTILVRIILGKCVNLVEIVVKRRKIVLSQIEIVFARIVLKYASLIYISSIELSTGNILLLEL